jgi:long-chain acyl-CoA synthetase
MSVAEAHARLTAKGAFFEMEEIPIRGIRTRVYKNAPPSIRAVVEFSRNHKAADFLVFGDERVSFAAHYRAVAALAAALTQRFDVKKGERVAIAMRNHPEWAVALFATVSIGAVAVPLNAWGSGEELEYGISDSGAKIAIVDEERASRLAPYLSGLRLAALIISRAEEPTTGALKLEDLIGAPSAYGSLAETPLPPAVITPDDDATIFYTSGTTGKPKGARGTHRNMMTNLMSMGLSGARAALRRGDPWPAPTPASPRSTLLSVPLFHATGCHSVLVPHLALGYKLVLIAKWDPLEAMRLIEKERLNGFGGVPAMAWQVIEHPERAKFDLSSLDTVSYGGAPAAPELPRRIREAFPKVMPGNGYGMTETSAITSQCAAEEYIAHPESCGVAVPVCDVKVCDEAGRALSTGEAGELWVKGPNVVNGYWGKPEDTAQTFRDGWVLTGDIARIDEEGYIYILDRAKDMLIRGGENIYCVEVESVLYRHPAVMDAAIVGLPHKVLGEEVGAVVQLKPGTNVSEAELQDHVAAHLARFKVPIAILLREEPLPRNPNGKILKRQLREEFAKLRS